VDRRLATAETQSGVCLGESLKLSLNVSFTLDSTGSNPVHSTLSPPLCGGNFFCKFDRILEENFKTIKQR